MSRGESRPAREASPLRAPGRLTAPVSCLLAILFAPQLSAAEPLPQRSLAIDGKIAADASSVELNWAKASGKRIGRIDIQRRILGERFAFSWQDLASVSSFARIFEDKTTEPGIAYEYRVSRPSQQQVETGYWVAGRELPADENSGVALVVVDETLAAALAARLDRFVLDLVGDGWRVLRHDAPRGNRKDPVANLEAARAIRAWIQRQYYANASLPHALILVGRIPIVTSGRAYPDGHARRPLETDLFYADTNGVWRDDGEGILQPAVIPSDHIEMQVGRIDFSNFDGALGSEISLLEHYFDKNHHWRHGRLGDLREAYGGHPHLTVETNALRNIVGPGALTTGGHHDTGTRRPWLFGVDFGKSNYEHYIGEYPIKAVFSINFGSGKLDFSHRNNSLSVMLAQRWYALATGWGGRPAWQLHHMALGRSVGYSHWRTVNNGTRTFGAEETLEYTPTGHYTWLNPIWVNLLGDPTLRPFPLPPVGGLEAELRGGKIHLGWRAPQGASGLRYRVYRAPDRFGPYRPLNPSRLLTDTRFVDPQPVPGAHYMVRAHALQDVYAGSFYVFSQGAFTAPGRPAPRAASRSLATPQGQQVAIRPADVEPDAGRRLVVAPVAEPAAGRLRRADGGWAFVPEPDFTGRVQLRFSLFDGLAADTATIDVDVLKP